jgi:hypothetical protein
LQRILELFSVILHFSVEFIPHVWEVLLVAASDTQPTNQMKPTYTNLAKFRYANRQNVANIGIKSIMRVETARTLQWWLVLPAIGESDSRCILLHKCSNTQPLWSISQCEPKIIAEENARAAARLS